MSRTSNVAKRKLADRDLVFPTAAGLVYDHTKHDGFATIPKVMPLIFLVMDKLSVGKPLSLIYFDLFCFVFNTKEGYLCGLNPKSRAYYAGLQGQRAAYVWTERMHLLAKHGFILIEKGESGDLHHILIVNPLMVMEQLIKSPPVGLDRVLLQTYTTRLREVGGSESVTSDVSTPAKAATAKPEPTKSSLPPNKAIKPVTPKSSRLKDPNEKEVRFWPKTTR